ncbi:hypothetical protein CCC_00397 [Paramagnetospirillum magnetotacticum MS-1]|uniref:Uncharacterized protein n=1 Tax=Paramagnetospirillum magnetotacticum MS-1 TaxID=272627 RepID=A0A0C2UWY2_PARME|nr:hypothetical protein [Paramagnetospirillum magnetotacticum]KIL97336.1 hypothetical protein CCC_00397 [Paramagnetospirillum magnetotacticum MS-1]
MVSELLRPDSEFSRAVYKEIRPAIPRAQWPTSALRASFTPSSDGLALIAAFEGLPPAYAAVAAQVVLRAKVDLVLVSPVAVLASAVVYMRRWRDTFLYALLPLLFAIPLMAPLGDAAMRASFVLFSLNMAALLVTHARLLQRRAKLQQGRFIAEIPSPGLRIKVPQGTPLHPQD